MISSLHSHGKDALQGKRPKVLAVASRGGHWIQLLRLRPALQDCNVIYVTTDPEYKSMVEGSQFLVVSEATRFQLLKVLFLALQLFLILFRERPAIIISTGAAPGYLAIRIGKWFGARTIWIDSLANAEEISLSGRLASKYADVTLTQWSHLERPGGPMYRGAVI